MANVIDGPDPLYTLLKAMIAGVPNLPAGLTSVSVLGATYTMAALGTKLGTYETVYGTAANADVALKTALEARANIEDEAHKFVMATANALKAALGPKSATLSVVGLNPDKTPEALTVEQKTEKVAKGAATRAARHTMGPRQKAKIKGQVPATTTPATPAPVVTPAVAAKPST